MSPAESYQAPETITPTLGAVVLFDDDDCAHAARMLCSRYEFDAGLGPITTSFHRFDELAAPDGRSAVLKEAIHAQMLIFATTEASPLPRTVKFWLGAFLGIKGQMRCTIVAITKITAATDSAISPTQDYLRDLAKLEAMPFATFHVSGDQQPIQFRPARNRGPAQTITSTAADNVLHETVDI